MSGVGHMAGLAGEIMDFTHRANSSIRTLGDCMLMLKQERDEARDVASHLLAALEQAQQALCFPDRNTSELHESLVAAMAIAKAKGAA